MPAIIDDPASPTIYRVSGARPYQDPSMPRYPSSIVARQVTLRDRQTVATVLPFASSSQVPPSLIKYLSDQFAKEIRGGDTYPMLEPMPLEKFAQYWFQNFAAIMLLGTIDNPEDVVEGKDWSKECLGSFYIKPNYPGRSSHVSNAGFLVTDAARNRGVGRLMGESYLDWAPKLGYTYSVFNLVYETNVASCKIWDALGFKRIGRVKGCGNLKSYPDRLVDAIIYGRDLGEAAGDGADGPVSEERFDKIKFYLKFGRYPNGSDRAEKSRLRSAATHYKLLENDVLMLKGKEVISDPVLQMDIAKRFHEAGSHAGINKTTATIAERYHWSRIKETVSDVIRLCAECKELGKLPTQTTAGSRRAIVNETIPPIADPTFDPAHSDLSPSHPPGSGGVDDTSRILDLHHHHHGGMPTHDDRNDPYVHPDNMSFHSTVGAGLEDPDIMLRDHPHAPIDHPHHQSHHETSSLSALHDDPETMYAPIDPQIISQQTHDPFNSFHAHDIPHHHSPHTSHTSLPGHDPFHPHLGSHHSHSAQPASFQTLHALLHDPDAIGHSSTHHHNGDMQHHDTQQEHDQAAADRDLDRALDMLIDHDRDSEMEDITLGNDMDPGERGQDDEGGTGKRDVHLMVDEDDGLTKRRTWDHVVFDVLDHDPT